MKNNIDYETLTEEQLEELVEDVDWSLVPGELLTDYIKEKFGSITNLKIRLYLDDLIPTMTIKVDEKTFPNTIFFFVGNIWYMDYDKEEEDLWCSMDKIWSIFEKSYSNQESTTFLNNIFQRFFTNILSFHSCWKNHSEENKERLFKTFFENKKINPVCKWVRPFGNIEEHFKNK